MLSDLGDTNGLWREKYFLFLVLVPCGIGAAWVLAQLHANVVLNDYKPVEFEPSTRKRLEDAGVTIIYGATR